MPLSPKVTASGVPVVFSFEVEQSALIESSYSSVGSVATNATIALGWKPTAATITPLIDMTNHYLLTIRKVGDVITVWKNNVVIATLSYATVGGTTYAALLQNVLTALSGSYHGYYSRMYVLDGTGRDYSTFYKASPLVSGLWLFIKTPSLTYADYGDNGGFYDFNNASNLGADNK